MTTRTTLLTAAAFIALMGPAHAQEDSESRLKTSFSQTINAIKGWFDADEPQQADADTAETTTAASDDSLQVPPHPDGPDAIEPAAGAMDEDLLQVPPPYHGPQPDPNATPRASAFDANPAMAAFGDGAEQSPEALAGITPAAGEGSAITPENVDCDAVLKAADEAAEGDVPDTALIEMCETPQEIKSNTPLTDPAQPAFEMSPMPKPLPETQPAAGEPPVGGAVMPGENPVDPQ